jgi:chemotaxis methyl-accepting protein methylase/chemotaxis receptor (MCP) glutamine deamidase CheD
MKFEHYQRKFIEKRIDFRMKNLNLNYYQDYIKYIRANPVEVDLFLDKFTINYTYFFRNFKIFENFENYIKFYVNYTNKSLRIWSAPCATGDEPYSIAIVLDQLKKNNKNFPEFKIIASDIDPAALEIARKGIYGEYSVHEIPEIYLKAYFSKHDTDVGPKFILSNDIKDKVEIIQEDIIKGHQKNTKYDVIFCRNFFIYINQFAREKLLKIVDSRLFDGGLLILGGSETLPTKNSNFQAINMRDRFYIKNLSTQDGDFKNRVYNLFKNRTISIFENQKPKQKRMKHSIANKIQTKDRIKSRLKESLNIAKIPEKEIEKKKSKPDNIVKELNELERIETDVRITAIEVNNGSKANEYKHQNNQLKEFMKNNIEESENSGFKKWSQKLKQRELLLEEREKAIEESLAYLDEKYKKIKNERKEINDLLKNVKEQEVEVKNRIEILERLTRRVEQRERLVKQKEKQFERRIRQVGNYTRQVVQQEVQINGISKKLIEDEENQNDYDQKRLDRIDNLNNKKELKIPMGYYGLINSFDKSEIATKFIIKGLGSGIALIIKDPVNNIFAMSNISLPSSSASKQGYHLLFPHTFVDTSVNDLYNNLLYNGANKSNITALIIGGAKLFLDYDMTYQENIDAVKGQLEANQISIEAEDIGGISERAVIYDTINDALYVKKTWEFEYRKIN